MKNSPVFPSLVRWIYSTELFARPSRQLPGKWKLFEYYAEPGEYMVNIKEEHLEKTGYYWNIYFERFGQLSQEMNLPFQFLTDTSACNWQTSRNFLTLADINTPGIKVEFQFAVSRGSLKLLKKDTDGKIIFFGFFRKIEESS